MKTCSNCKKEKSLSEFYKNISKKDGLDGFCKLCRGIATTKYYYKNYEKSKAQGRKRVHKYRQEHKEELKEKNRKYYKEHYFSNPDIYIKAIG